MDKLEQIKKKIEEIQAKSAVSTEMKAFITLVLSVVNKSKQELEKIGQENIKLIKDSVEYITDEHEKLLESVSQETSKSKEEQEKNKKDFEIKLKRIDSIINELKSIEVKDGYTPEKGTDYFTDEDKKEMCDMVKKEIPEHECEEIEGEEIVEKINELPLTEDKKIDASHIKNLPFPKGFIGGGSTARNFYQLFDTPDSYVGQGLKGVRVKADETGLEFFTGSGLIEWGEIGGTITNQTDLITYLGNNYWKTDGTSAPATGNWFLGDIDFSVGTNTFYVDHTNFRIGIGTDTPTNGQLEIVAVDTHLPSVYINGNNINSAIPTLYITRSTGGGATIDNIVSEAYDDDGTSNICAIEGRAYPNNTLLVSGCLGKSTTTIRAGVYGVVENAGTAWGGYFEDNTGGNLGLYTTSLVIGDKNSDILGSANDPLIITGTINDFYAFDIQNLSSGDSASTDIIARANNDSTTLGGHYTNMGVYSSGFSSSAVGNVKRVTIRTAGSGYHIGDILTIIAGDSNAQVEVLTLSGSGVATVALIANGTGYSVASGLSTTVSPPGGTGCVLDVVQIYDNTIYSANDGYLFNSGGNLVIGTDDTVASKSIKFHTNGFSSSNLRMIITSVGRVGIGTSSPVQLLDVNGRSYFRDTTDWFSYGRASWNLSGATNQFTMYAQTGNRLALGAGGTPEYMTISTTGNVGIGTATPQTALSFPSASTGISLYNTADMTTNYEQGLLSWSSNVLTLQTSKGGTGTARDVNIKSPIANLIIKGVVSANPSVDFDINSTNISNAIALRLTNGTLFTSSSGVSKAVMISPTVAQSGTAGYTGLTVNVTESSTGSGTKLLQDWQTGGVSKMALNSAGNLGIGTAPNASYGIDVVGSINSSAEFRGLSAKVNEIYNYTNGNRMVLFSTNDWLLYGQADITFRTSRNTTADTAGFNFTMRTGGATLGSTNKNGGNYIIESGISTGTGYSYISAQTSPRGSSGTSDNAYVEQLTIGNTAKLTLLAGTATANTAPLKFTSGTNLTTAETGAMEYNGTNLFFTPTGTLRESVFTGARGSITLTAGTTTTVTVSQAKTTSTIIISPTSSSVIALQPYVSTKNNGSFVITTLTALGTETLDYLVIN